MVIITQVDGSPFGLWIRSIACATNEILEAAEEVEVIILGLLRVVVTKC